MIDFTRRLTEGRRSGLFARIYATFVITVVAATVCAIVGTLWFARASSEEWVANTIEALEEENDELVERLGDDKALSQRVESLSDELGTQVGVYDGRGRLIAGDGPAKIGRRARRYAPRLGRGVPVIHHREKRRGVIVLFPLTDPYYDETLAVVHVLPPRRSPVIPVAFASVFILVILGVGARVLAGSLARRLGRLERSADRIASGELGHRVAIDHEPAKDELDELGLAFNDMAERLQALMVGQKTLLANVSHELRTPVARVKVLLELLEERCDNLAGKVSPKDDADLVRLRGGLGELASDVGEVETLISDLLTSGRLELRAGESASIERRRIALSPLLRRVADKFAARVDCDEAIEVSVDEMLVERLISNLVANARRHCPEGDIAVLVTKEPEQLLVAVQDEGSGVPLEHRESIFEPFVRLDAARNRDTGGVGLGLYLSRQIARVHGGDLTVTDRPDGRPGARMEFTLPTGVRSP